MKTRTQVLILVILAVVGSFVNFYASNMILSDISNMFYGVHDVNFIASLPAFAFAIEFVLATLCFIRCERRSQYLKKTLLLYTRFGVALSIIGVLSAIYGGIAIYKSFVMPYPFPYYIIISIVVHLFIVVSCFIVNVRAKKKLPDDTEKRRVDFGYVLYSGAFALITFITYNRLGALIWAVTYVNKGTLYMTFPFYLSLLLPLALLVHVYLYIFGRYDNHLTAGIIYNSGGIAADVGIAIAVFGIGAANPVFISVISPALAIERLLTLPIDTVVHFSLVFILGFYCLYLSIKLRKKRTKKLNTQN